MTIPNSIPTSRRSRFHVRLSTGKSRACLAQGLDKGFLMHDGREQCRAVESALQTGLGHRIRALGIRQLASIALAQDCLVYPRSFFAFSVDQSRRFAAKNFRDQQIMLDKFAVQDAAAVKCAVRLPFEVADI